MNLVIFRQPPYGTSYTGEGIRVLSSFGAFEIGCHVLFVDDGVFSLVKDQNPHDLEMKSVGTGIARLVQVGIEKFLVSEESLQERGLKREELCDLQIQLVTKEEIRTLMGKCNSILTF
jgi:tRNA 2-thiouridine synthesizing protein C